MKKNKAENISFFCFTLLGLLSCQATAGVLALLDGGDFIAADHDHEGEVLQLLDAVHHAHQADVCPVVDWRDMFLKSDICVVDHEDTAAEDKGQHGNRNNTDILGVEEINSEEIKSEAVSLEVDSPHLEKTDPLPPLTIRPLGLNVAPLPRVQTVVPQPPVALLDEKEDVLVIIEKETDETKSDTVVGVQNNLQPEAVEEKQDAVEVKEHKPYIVKAIPKDMVQAVAEVEVERETVNATTLEEIEVIEEVPKEDKMDEKYPPSESSVEEELLETPVETEDVIAPFSQWAEKKLVEEALLKDATKKESEPETESNGVPIHPVTNPSPAKTNGVKLTKNFASPDCSAKIMGANLESQGSGNVITHSRDEYFLNKCTDQAWFVVELCESIKALKIQIANFELYSSSPNHFRVSIGNVFPGRDKDWMEFGSFSYLDERNIQTFKSEVGVVGKYARVEILSHHGSEHYCPVSMFKVYGISEIDLITEDDPNDDHEDAPEETVDDELSEHIIVKTIKDAVHKVVNVFRPQNVSLVATLNTSSLQGASLRFKLRPEGGQKQDQEVVNRYHMIYYLLATQYQTVRQYTRIMGLQNLLPLLCSQYGVPLTQNTTLELVKDDQNSTCARNSLPWQFARFVRVVHGEDFLVALCNVVSMELGQSRLVEGGRVGENLNITSTHKGGENKTMTLVKTAEVLVQDVNIISETDSDNVVTIQTKVTKEKEVLNPGQADKDPHHDPPPSEPPSSHPQAEPVALKPGPAASSAKPASTASVVNTASQAGQTTWQKLSNRIKALERNVTLSSGFLEELSLKYIKQIEELNTAVKLANDAIGGVIKREEIARDRGDLLASQVYQLSKNLEELVVRVGELQEEVLARHGLLLLLEVLVIGLVFLLCRPGGDRMGGSKSVGSMVDRRRSLDTIRGEREKDNNRQEKRRSSIEVGCLPNGQVGSMVSEVPMVGLSKKQRKKKRRRDSRLSLRNVVEEMESDDSKVGASVYDTFHGAEQRRVVDHRKRSRSWSEQQQNIPQGEDYCQADIGESSMANTSASVELESPSRFAVDQVWEQGEPKHSVYVEDMPGQDGVFSHNYESFPGNQGLEYRSRYGKEVDNLQDRQNQYMIYHDRRYLPRASDILPYHPGRSTYLSNSRQTMCSSIPHPTIMNRPPSMHHTTATNPDPCKSVWFPGRSRKGSVIRVSNTQPVNGHPKMEVSNMYNMLDHSVHETSACETEGEDLDREKVRLVGKGLSSSRQQKPGRSKSSSPNRQANLLMRRQRDAIRKFQPDQAEWLHKKRDS